MEGGVPEPSGAGFLPGALVRLGGSSPWIAISHFTPEYRREAAKLIASLACLPIDYHVQPIASLGSWWANVHCRPSFLLAMLDVYPGRDIVWIDADGIVRRYPELLDSLDRGRWEVAVHFRKGVELLGGTMWVANTEAGRRLMAAWAEYDASRLQFKEQYNLQALLRIRREFRVAELPATYCQIFDLMRGAGEPVIEHFQASRRMRWPAGRARKPALRTGKIMARRAALGTGATR